VGIDTKIQWCHHTFNPWWGCERVSPGCVHCYAEAFAKRTGHSVWGSAAQRRFFGDKHWAEPLKWDRDAGKAGERRRVFCASMADVFEDRPDLVDDRARLSLLVQATPWLDWLLLTKRPENVDRLWRPDWPTNRWPENVWLGTTVEDQERADERITRILSVPAAVHFLSVEPLLGPVDLRRFDGGDWVIVGGESGAGARPCDVEWVRSVISQCRDASVACFVKQLGARPYDSAVYCEATFFGTDPLCGTYTKGNTLALRDHKGGDPDEWPQDLRVREFPRQGAIS
jgi:protein gp37